MKRISLRLPDELHERALEAVQTCRAAHGRASSKYSLNDFIVEATEQAVERTLTPVKKRGRK